MSQGNSAWERELAKELDVTWGDAKAILQIAKAELGIDQKDYPEESKGEIFAKCREVGESYEKAPKPEKVVHPKELRQMEAAEEAGEKGEVDEVTPPRPPSWEKQLVKELDVTWKDARAILQIAKNELGIPEKEYPEDMKEEAFEKCMEISESFPKSPKVVMKDPKLSSSKSVDVVPEDEPAPETVAASAKPTREPIMTSQGEYGEHDKIDKDKLIVAGVLTLIVVAIIVGAAVGVKNSNKKKELEAAATEAPTGAPTTLACEPMVMKFSVPSLAVTLAVDSSISEPELNYADDVFLKTYGSMIKNDLELAVSNNYCDPYCRQVTDIEIISSEFVGNVTDTALTADGCDAYMEMIFAVDGTYVGCEDEPFPGLFALPSSARRLSLSSLVVPSFSQSHLRAGNEGRFLQSVGCGECSGEEDITGPTAPTTDELAALMEPYITVLPSVCELTSVDTLEIEKQEEDA